MFQQLERGIQIYQRSEEARMLREELGRQTLTNVHILTSLLTV
jgi:hypothetical protein